MSYNKRIIWVLFTVLLFFSSAFARKQGKVVGTKVIDIIRIDEAGKVLAYPGSLFYDLASKRLFLVEPGSSKVVFYTPDYFPFMAIGKGYDVIDPVDLFVDSKGKFYFVSTNTKSVYVLSPSLILEKVIKVNGFKGDEDFVPNHVAVNFKTGDIYITGVGKPFIVVFGKDGKFKDYLYPEMQVNGNKIYSVVSNVSVDSFGNVYLVALDFGQVFIFDKDGNFVRKFGTKGANFGQMSQPSSVAVDEKSGRIYVTDPMRHAVLAYNMGGDFLFEFGGRGWAPGWFNYPIDVAVDNKGNVIVTDWLNNRVQILKPETDKVIEVKTLPPSNRAD
ncbi:NHL repeat-containing protein [Desulfurobacterium atlanticum]|uniref:NHL repeat-containing protein n=1 Tax=Desulfurobacterium atlanticum TaxID=240169 RepID=A0A238ZV72_9BACT|nr:NHL repeat-containing protein [Desulfurobacterium atlanticum]SNR87307.1 NHL repeat-containing protein [Desulfurobacterium atlanticum]